MADVAVLRAPLFVTRMRLEAVDINCTMQLHH
jgi:hypothetical protein